MKPICYIPSAEAEAQYSQQLASIDDVAYLKSIAFTKLGAIRCYVFWKYYMKTNMKIVALVLILIFSTHAFAQDQNNPAPNDMVQISVDSKNELDGPAGIRLSCIQIANFDYSEFQTVYDGRALYNGFGSDLNNRKHTFERDEHAFNVKFVDWTPEIVVFLKNAVDTCVAHRNDDLLKRIMLSGNHVVSMSPSRVKKLFDDIFVVASATQTRNQQQIDIQRQWDVANQNKEIARQDHIKKLKSGEDKILSVEDAYIYYLANPLNSIISSPLLEPDKQYYYGEVIIDFQEKQNLLRGKIENYIDISQRIPKLITVGYAFLRTDNKTVSFDPQLLRIEQHIYILGKYIANTQYKTIAGEVKVSPVIQVLYMGGLKGN